MKRLIIVILVLVFSIFILACSTQPTASAPQNIAAENAAVTIEGFSFTPLELTVQKGTTVTWTNQDATPHTVTSDNGSELDSGTLSKGQSYTHTFNEAGTFEYHCKFHSMMKARLLVE